MSSTEINSLSRMAEQGGDILATSKDFGKTIKEIYDLYDALKDRWTGEKSDEYKKKIEELRDPLKIITGTIEVQGGAVQAAGEALQKFERA